MTETPITILHVDPSESFTDLLSEFVRQRHDHVVVHEAHSGEDALAHLESTDDVDCVVSDYEIPGLNGLELLAAVRERWPDMPFVLFTGGGNEAVVLKAIAAGVTDYLEKSADPDRLAHLIDRVERVVIHHRTDVELARTVRRTEAQFELLVDTIEDYAIFLLDEGGHVQTWNRGAEKIKGYTEDEILGEHFSVFYRDEDVAAGVPDRNLREASTKGRIRDEGWRVRKDGSEFWADVTITALQETGAHTGYAKITHDSTSRKREQELLEQTEQLEGIIAAISHDLQNPLAVASGNVRLALDAGDLSRLDAAESALERASQLLDHLSTLAQEGMRITQPEPIELSEAAAAAWTFAGTDEAELRVEEDCVLVADTQRLRQLLENLFGNAVTHGGPDVTVRVGPLDGGGFYVEDDGPGIPENERTGVFEMGHSTNPDGTGFGLAICKQIADSHGWFIEVVEGTDGGARFEISDVEVL
ncbi:response regulator [Salinigranum sp. GCM10025319]|uniref:response regulator n=1 Tax=Salinigranum sp. GCM10025319 TaxID=3252687 RepID=UPI00361AF034